MQPDFKKDFNTDFASILNQVASIDPIAYGKSRNYINGAVTYLSPYISRGVISTKQVLDSVMQRGYKLYEIESFVKELCWRDYFQRVGQEKNLSLPIKQSQVDVAHTQIPLAILQAKTGIEGIDQAIEQLYATGYMHNHARMYTASVVCNIAQSDWLMPAHWMYYHLLDGDWASNACSWQWVAAANSGKKYYANQENINKYSNTKQVGTFLDKTYEELAKMEIPAELKTVAPFTAEIPNQFQHPRPNQIQDFNHGQNNQLNQNPTQNQNLQFSPNTAVYMYNYYNLDPLWHKDEAGLRILLLDPEFFAQYPISSKCWNFMMQLAAEIPNLQVFHGSFASLIERLLQNTNQTNNQDQILNTNQISIQDSTLNTNQISIQDPANYHHAACSQQLKSLITSIRYKEHPLNKGYQGVEEPRDWIAPSVQGYYPSFFAYWKAVKKVLDKN